MVARRNETWLDRLKEERDELADRIVKLARFKLSDEFRDLPAAERKLLMDQHRHMNAYADVLHERICLAPRNPA